MNITGNHILIIIAIASFLMSIWNAYCQSLIGKVVAELQLNIRREYNGRYVTIASFDDAKARIKRLEEQKDEHSV